MKRILLLGVLLFIRFYSVQATELSAKYKLNNIDSETLSNYYILYFSDIVTGKEKVVLSEKELREEDGCWTFLKTGTDYALNIHEIFIIKYGKMYLSIKESGFSVDKKEIIPKGEYFYSTTEINGRLVRK